MAPGNDELVRSSFDAFLRGDWNALAQVMDPGVKWLWYEPGDWDCHDRRKVLATGLRGGHRPAARARGTPRRAAHGGRRETAELLLERGADPAWVGHDELTAREAAERSNAPELAAWLRHHTADRPPQS